MKEQKYTIAQWVESFPEPYRTQAKISSGKRDNWDRVVEGFYEAVDLSLWWNGTAEGWEYWKEFTLRQDVFISEKKTKLIPFDLEKAKAGAKAVYRDGSEVLEWHYFEQSPRPWKILSVYLDGAANTIRWNDLHGEYLHAQKNLVDSDYDLMIEVELEEKEYWCASIMGYNRPIMGGLSDTADQAIEKIKECLPDLATGEGYDHSTIQTHKIIRYE